MGNPPEGNRQNISLTMAKDLRKEIQPFHADILRVHMREVKLPSTFEVAFANVERLKLEQRQEIANKDVKLQQAKMANRTAVIKMRTEFDQKRVAAEIEVKKIVQQRP